MDPSPAQLRILLAVVACSLAATIWAVVWLVRSGRSVSLPDVSGGPRPGRPVRPSPHTGARKGLGAATSP